MTLAKKKRHLYIIQAREWPTCSVKRVPLASWGQVLTLNRRSAFDRVSNKRLGRLAHHLLKQLVNQTRQNITYWGNKCGLDSLLLVNRLIFEVHWTDQNQYRRHDHKLYILILTWLALRRARRRNNSWYDFLFYMRKLTHTLCIGVNYW